MGVTEERAGNLALSADSFKLLTNSIEEWKTIRPKLYSWSKDLEKVSLKVMDNLVVYDTEVLTDMLKRIGQKAEFELSDEDINMLVEHLKPAMRRKSANGVESTNDADSDMAKRMQRLYTDNGHPVPTAQEFAKMIAYVLRPQPPKMSRLNNERFLTHVLPNPYGYVTFEWKLRPVGNHPHLPDFPKEAEKVALEEWLVPGVLSKTAETVSSTLGDKADELVYLLTLNLRDMHIRQLFPR